jgi:NTE family protein
MTPQPDADTPVKKVALVLQGGGALGSYQAGVYEVMAGTRYLPEWVAGISIGAINAALIAGNPPETRVDRLRSFWERVTARPTGLPETPSDLFALWRQTLSAQSTLLLGQPAFFAPRRPLEWLGPGPTSYYSTAALKSTLESLVDFDRIGRPGEVRLSVGAVQVRTGRFAYFDSDHMRIRAEHIMASGALPPGFPPVEIDGEAYWDGGLVSNTPLAYVLDHLPRRSLLVFQIDLFQAYGRIPTTLAEVTEREKDIRYASRTRVTTEEYAEKHEMRHAINELIDLLPPELRATPQARALYRMGCVTEMDIVQLIYRPFAPQGPSKDYEFSRETMQMRWQQGMADAEETLRAAPWLTPKPREVGVRMFDVIHDRLMAELHPGAPDRDRTEEDPAAEGPRRRRARV